MEKKEFIEVNSYLIRYNLINLKQLVFEVTDACNLKCKYCAYAGLYERYDERQNKYLSFNKARLTIDYLVDLWRNNSSASFIQPLTISFYGGEPLINYNLIKEIVDYMENIRDINRKIFFSMTTNAVLLDKYMDYLVEKEFRLLISLDGDEYGQSYRVNANGENSFGRVMKNVKLLQAKFPDYFNKYVSFNSVLHNRNSVERTYHFIKKEFSKEPTISTLSSSGIRKDKIDEFWHTYQNMVSSIKNAPNCETLETELFIKNPDTLQLMYYLYAHSGNVYNHYTDLFIDRDRVLRFPTSTCLPFARKMFVTVNGKILTCERISHEFAQGLVSDNEVNLDLEKIAAQYNDYVFRYQKQCGVCVAKKKCHQCVYQIDDINNPDTKCPRFVSKTDHRQNEQQILTYLRYHPELYGRIMKEVRVS
jgi:uncharacterized protein